MESDFNFDAFYNENFEINLDNGQILPNQQFVSYDNQLNPQTFPQIPRYNESESMYLSCWSIAEQFASQRKIPQAISCLDSILTNQKFQFPPLVLVKTHLRIAEILLKFTDSAYTIISNHLNKALILASEQISWNIELQLQILSQFVVLYDLKKSDSLLKSTALNAIQIVASVPSHVSISDYWASFFIVKLAGVHRKEEDFDSALAFLNRGYAHALQKKNVKAQIVFLLNLSLVYLQQANVTKSMEMLEIVKPLVQENESGHFRFLRVMCLMASGNMNVAVAEIPSLQSANSSVCNWDTHLYALVCLVSGCCYRITGAVNSSMQLSEKGLDVVNRFLQDEVTPTGQVPLWKLSSIHSALYIKFFLLENTFYLFLLQNNFVSALSNIVKMTFLYQKMKDLFSPFKFMIHLAMGHLSQALGLDSGIGHFEKAYKLATDSHNKIFCMICLCFLYLQSQSYDKLDNLVQFYRNIVGNHPSIVVKAYFYVIEGKYLAVKGYPKESHAKYREVIHILNNRVPNSQLMAKSLTIIGEAFVAPNSFAQAEQMLSSSAIISSKIGDISNQLYSLHLLGVIYRKVGDNERQVQNFEYFNQQTAKLLERRKEVDNDPRVKILDEFLQDADLQFK